MSEKTKAPKWGWDETRADRLEALYAEVPADVRADKAKNKAAMETIAKTLASEFKYPETEVNARKVTSKLVSLGVYVKPDEAPKAPKDDGPSKKEILDAIAEAAGEDFEAVRDGFMPANKAALAYLAKAVGVNAGDSEV